MFYQGLLSVPNNMFGELANSVKFESIARGREGTNIVKIDNNLVPIVRTTTPYTDSAQNFNQTHNKLIELVCQTFSTSAYTKVKTTDFNNGMCEIYTGEYRKMGWHTDQSLDLEPNSWICICSFYEDISIKNYRKLVVQNKTNKETFEIILKPNYVVMFSTNTNSHYIHKIVLPNEDPTSRWLGITLRKSKTLIDFSGGKPVIANTNQQLHLASVEEKSQIIKLKGIENNLVDFNYPPIYYTISPSDLIYPIN